MLSCQAAHLALRAAHQRLHVVRTAYHGPYERLPQAWPQFLEWIKAHGHTTREDAFEVYSIGPRDNPDPDAWQTDLIYPLASDTAAKERVI